MFAATPRWVIPTARRVWISCRVMAAITPPRPGRRFETRRARKEPELRAGNSPRFSCCHSPGLDWRCAYGVSLAYQPTFGVSRLIADNPSTSRSATRTAARQFRSHPGGACRCGSPELVGPQGRLQGGAANRLCTHLSFSYSLTAPASDDRSIASISRRRFTARSKSGVKPLLSPIASTTRVSACATFLGEPAGVFPGTSLKRPGTSSSVAACRLSLPGDGPLAERPLLRTAGSRPCLSSACRRACRLPPPARASSDA